MATTPELIAAAFRDASLAVDGVEQALDYEPKTLPRRPCVTMLMRVPEQTDGSTGLITDVTWTWTVTLYLDLRDYQRAQAQMAALMPSLLAITRLDPLLGGTCDHATLSSAGDDPIFDHDEGWVACRFRLTAETSEG